LENPSLSFSAYLGYLGVLGERLFLGDLYALTIGATRSSKKPIAEDAEVAEVRREKRMIWPVIYQ